MQGGQAPLFLFDLCSRCFASQGGKHRVDVLRIAEVHNHILFVSKVISVVDAENVAMNGFLEQKANDADSSSQLCIHFELG